MSILARKSSILIYFIYDIFEKMPVKNSKKQYKSGGIYHIYNRGVNKDKIFFQESDYEYFLNLLSSYVSKPLKNERDIRRNYHRKVEILAFCLMENHFHFLLKQARKRIVSEFMRSLTISYTLYFNKKYDRVGHLFQGVYKARLIKDSEDLISISKYIHLNPEKPAPYPYSSLTTYLEGISRYSFVKTTEVLSNFSNKNIAIKMYSDYLFRGSDPRSDPLPRP
jgi:putative transposase